ncbi:hypothetical protein MHL31_14165 [Lutibacter sp. A80]|nr:hypothetical protein [Lutibacter sp. A80]UMB60218.1 hypothetical protein MHL31_14165 [Lutibacter sp. A80]
MTSSTSQHSFTPEKINQTALKDYKTYLNYYASKKLKPMTFEDFSKNYSN